MFKKYSEYLLVFILSVVLTAVVYFFLSQIEHRDTVKSKIQVTLENISHRWNDLFYPEYSTQKPNPNVVLLAIDESSIIEVGRWPWSRSVLNKITSNLLNYDIKTLTYDIIFSEKENTEADAGFAKTISEHADKVTLGTFSDSPSNVLPYQDFCLTEAFLYTGGASLAKINPFFAVEDDTNYFEEVQFNRLFEHIFKRIDVLSEKIYLKNYDTDSVKKLSYYQHNTLVFYKKQRIYDYCRSWLTDKDPYEYKQNDQLKTIYQSIFNATDEMELQKKLNAFTKTPLKNPILQYEKWLQNIEVIQNAAQYTASFLAAPDPDGVIRNYPLIYRTGNKLGTSYIPSPAIQAYLSATGYQILFKVKTTDKNKQISAVEIHNLDDDSDEALFTIPTDHEGKLLINYYGKQNMIYYVSAKDLLNNSPNLEYSIIEVDEKGPKIIKNEKVDKISFLKDKNIIMGATAIGIYDIRTTPTDINYPGPEIHATVLSNLLNKQYLKYDRQEPRNSPLIFFIFILLTLLFFIKLGIRSSAILFVLLAGLLYLIQKNNYEQGTVFQSAFLYFILLFVAFFITLIYKYFFQSRKSNEIKMAFSKYVSKDVVEEILKNEGAIELRGQKLFMSVYFSDIRGFTAFSEKMDAVELSELLNKYFTPMSAIITRHQGTIDKYIGDAIMAMFGAPLNYKDHAIQACNAALGCIAALAQLNREFALKNWPKIKIGIGINTGYMNAGNIGSETIQNYTVIGDSVNLASRLESLTKEYAVDIIISEFTYEIIKESFNCRELDKVKVKGKQELVTIYELIGVK